MAWGINHVIMCVSAVAHYIANAPWAVRDASFSWFVQNLMPNSYQRSLPATPATSSSSSTFTTAVLSALSSSTSSLVSGSSSVLRPFVTTATATTTLTVTTTKTYHWSSPSSSPGSFDSYAVRMPPAPASQVVPVTFQPGLVYNGYRFTEWEVFGLVAVLMLLLLVLQWTVAHIVPCFQWVYRRVLRIPSPPEQSQLPMLCTAPIYIYRSVSQDDPWQLPTPPQPPHFKFAAWLDDFVIKYAQLFDIHNWTKSSSICIRWICWLIEFPAVVILRLFMLAIYVCSLAVVLTMFFAIFQVQELYSATPPCKLLRDILCGTVTDPLQTFEDSKWPKSRLALAVLLRQYHQSALFDTRTKQNCFTVPYTPGNSVQATATAVANVTSSSRELELAEELDLAHDRARQSQREHQVTQTSLKASVYQLDQQRQHIAKLESQYQALRCQNQSDKQEGESERLAVASVRSQLADAVKAAKQERLGRKLAEEKHVQAEKKHSALEESFRLSLSAAQQQPQGELDSLKALLEASNTRGEQLSSAGLEIQQELVARTQEVEQLKGLAATAATAQQTLTARGEEIEKLKSMAQEEISAKEAEVDDIRAKATKLVSALKSKIKKLEESSQQSKDEDLASALAKEKAETARLMTLGQKVQAERDQARSASEAQEEKLQKLLAQVEKLKALAKTQDQLVLMAVKNAGLAGSRFATDRSAVDKSGDTDMDLDGQHTGAKSAGFGAKPQNNKQGSEVSGFGTRQQDIQPSPFATLGTNQQGTQPSAFGNNGFGRASSFGNAGFGSNQPSNFGNAGFGGQKNHQASGFGNAGFGNAQQNSQPVRIPGLTLLGQNPQPAQVPDLDMMDQDAPGAQPPFFGMLQQQNNQGSAGRLAALQDAFEPVTLEGSGSNQNNAQPSGNGFMDTPTASEPVPLDPKLFEKVSAWHQKNDDTAAANRASLREREKAWAQGRSPPKASQDTMERRAVRALPPPRTGLVANKTQKTSTDQSIGQALLETASKVSPCSDRAAHNSVTRSLGLRFSSKPQSGSKATEKAAASVPLSILKDESGNAISPEFAPNSTSFTNTPEGKHKPMPPSVAAAQDTPSAPVRTSPNYTPTTPSSSGYAHLPTARIPSSKHEPGAFKMKPSPLAQAMSARASQAKPSAHLSKEIRISDMIRYDSGDESD